MTDNGKKAMQAAVKHALGGRKVFGTREHGIAVKFLVDAIVEAAGRKQQQLVDANAEAIVKIGNLSQTQQSLAKAGVITRMTKEGQKESLWSDLKAS